MSQKVEFTYMNSCFYLSIRSSQLYAHKKFSNENPPLIAELVFSLWSNYYLHKAFSSFRSPSNYFELIYNNGIFCNKKTLSLRNDKVCFHSLSINPQVSNKGSGSTSSHDELREPCDIGSPRYKQKLSEQRSEQSRGNHHQRNIS